MSKGDVHTLPHNGGWANKIEGSSRVANTALKKAEARAKGREMAIRRRVEHLIHNKDGTIGQGNSCGRIRADARARHVLPAARPGTHVGRWSAETARAARHIALVRALTANRRSASVY